MRKILRMLLSPPSARKVLPVPSKHKTSSRSGSMVTGDSQRIQMKWFIGTSGDHRYGAGRGIPGDLNHDHRLLQPAKGGAAQANSSVSSSSSCRVQTSSPYSESSSQASLTAQPCCESMLRTAINKAEQALSGLARERMVALNVIEDMISSRRVLSSARRPEELSV